MISLNAIRHAWCASRSVLTCSPTRVDQLEGRTPCGVKTQEGHGTDALFRPYVHAERNGEFGQVDGVRVGRRCSRCVAPGVRGALQYLLEPSCPSPIGHDLWHLAAQQ